MVNPEASIDLEEQLRVLRESYKASLPGKMEDIFQAWQEAQYSDDPLPALEKLVFLSHRLSGSGASYGYISMSEKARLLELYLKTLLQAKILPDSRQKAEIEEHLAGLKWSALEPDPPFPAFEEENHPSEEPRAPFIPHDRPIFVVEHDPALAKDLTVQIGHFGYTVNNFIQLDELKKAMQQNTPAAVIMNINLPEIEQAGVEAVAEIRREGHESVPVMFLSTFGDMESRLHAVRLGGQAYFTNPININELVDKLDQLTALETHEPYRVLIVEDDPALASFYSLTLQTAGMETSIVNDPLQVHQPLVEFNPDLILIDFYMPGCSGLELAAIIRQQEAFLSIPIVFLSREMDLEKQMTAMLVGGDDFLTKPIRPEHLVSAVNARARRSRLLRSFMVRDGLTGLYNHTAIKGYLRTEVMRAARQGTPLALAIIDIDNFKSVNDSYGHPIGDRVIKSLSRLLKQRLRRTDIIGRYGGEEFAVILPDTSGSAARKVLDEIRNGFSQVRQRSNEGEFSVTLSGGIACFPNYPDAVSLTDAADKALYEAKHSGRNIVVVD